MPVAVIKQSAAVRTFQKRREKLMFFWDRQGYRSSAFVPIRWEKSMTTTPNRSYAQAWFFDEYNETTRAILQHWMNSNKKHHDVAPSKSRKCETMSNLDWGGLVPHVSPCIVTPRAIVHRGCDVFFHMRSVWISYKHPATPTNTISLIIQNLQLIH